MPRAKLDRKREHRIVMDIVVDAYDAWERAMGWYYYLEKNVSFPFTAECAAKRLTSPLQPGDEIEVLSLPSEDECEHEVFVIARWETKGGLAVPLSQLRVVHGDAKTRQAVEDGLYWVKMGCEF